MSALTAEQVREAIESNSWAETFSIREFSNSSWQAIADELNACEGRTCKNEDGWCSECEHFLHDGFKWCPWCGAKVVDE